MNDTYATDDQIASENNAPLPRWYGAMRAMVFTLLAVSILAMVAIGVFAVKLILSAGASTPVNIETLYDPARIPDGAELISVAPINGGGSFIVYQDGNAVAARAYDSNGILTDETVYE